MKNNIKYLFLAFSVCFLTHCKPDYSDLYYKDSPFVSFPEVEDYTFEGISAQPTERKLQVNRSTGDLSKSLTVKFTSSAKYITGNNINGVVTNAYTLLGDGGDASALVIPAGKASAMITLKTIDNTLGKNEGDGYKEVTITLTDSDQSDLKIGYPGPAATGKVTKVIIFDDEDTSYNIFKFLGRYDCEEVGAGNYDVRISRGSVPNSIVVKNFWDSGYEVSYNIDPLTGRVVLVPNETYQANVSSGGERLFYFITGDTASPFGTINNITGEFRVPYLVRYKKKSDGQIFTNTVDRSTHIYRRK